MAAGALAAAALAIPAAAPPRWELVQAAPHPIIPERLARPHGIGGFETGSFVKVGGSYHAYINELPNQMPWAKCPALWWDATTQLGHWTATSVFGPWHRTTTVRNTPPAEQCSGTFNFTQCDVAQPPVETWNSGGLLFGRNALNGSAEVWSLFFGSRWAVSTVGGPAGITGPFVDVRCVPNGGLAPGQPARPVPSYRLRNGSYRGFWQADWPRSTEKNCSWPCHRQRLVGLTGTESTVIGAGSWEVIPTGQLGQALPLVWKEQTPNVENPVVIPSTDGKEFVMVYDALSMNATCRNDRSCGWVGNQCWSNTACSAIGIAWSADGSTWSSAEHLVVQHDPRAQCGLVRTPLGLVPEPKKCKGCYSVLFTGWGAPAADHADVAASAQANASGGVAARGHALRHCPSGDRRCQVYQGYKPVCAALIRNTREAAAAEEAAHAEKNDDTDDDATSRAHPRNKKQPAPLLPSWPATYNMSESTVVQPCNYSGLYDFDAYPDLAKFGICSYDWSSAKKTWVNHSPMDADVMLLTQAAENKARNPHAKVFVYRNIVKALPWFSQVRKLLEDQAHWGWFLSYQGCRTAAGEYVCKNNKTGEVDASANLWHDEVQTPGWTGGGNGGPDGVCHGDTKGDTGEGCDCGHGVSCGGYIWDHRNTSLLRWLTDEYIGGSKLGLGSPSIDGFFLDDEWSTKGPSETPFPCTPRGTGAGRCARLSPAELSDLIDAWKSNMDAVQASIVAQGGYSWQNFRSVRTPQKAACATFLREACSNGSQVQSSAMQFWLSYEFNADKSGGTLTNFAMDLGVFLATRGAYAWLGYGWMGCGCGWDGGGRMPCDLYERPAALDADFGAPTELCHEGADGVFTRRWTKSTVTVDCNAYTAKVEMRAE